MEQAEKAISSAIAQLRGELTMLDNLGMELAGTDADAHNFVCEAETIIGDALEKLRFLRKQCQDSWA